jgi:hypothetical protein
MKSDIFDEYEKIATQMGLVSEAEEPKESKELKKFKDDVYPRAGSDDITTIEALYGVKSDMSVEYKHNIMEAAHPKMQVIMPAYDKINGLVENEIEGQHIRINLVRTPNHGCLDRFKLAKTDLMKQLVRIANDMDNTDKEDLRLLADTCIEKLGVEKKKSNPLTKTAILPWIIGGAIVLAAIWAFEHLDDPDRGLAANIDNALKKLNDLETNSWYESDIDETVRRDAEVVKAQIMKLVPGLAQFQHVMSDIQKPQSLEALQEVVSHYGQPVKEQLHSFIELIEQTTPILKTAIRNFTSSSYQAMHSKPSWLGEVSSYIGEALHGRWGEIANDFISTANALRTLQSSLDKTNKDAANIANVVKQNIDMISNKVKEAPAAQPAQTNLHGFEASNAPKHPEFHDEPAFNNMQGDNFAEMVGYKPSDKEKAFFGSILK